MTSSRESEYALHLRQKKASQISQGKKWLLKQKRVDENEEERFITFQNTEN